jgi:hypothetical protein
MNAMFRSLVVVCAVAALPATGWAQKGRDDQEGHRHGPPPAQEAAVDFGVLPTGPLGPPPCLQAGGIGGPGDPCSYLIHHLTPEETTIGKGGEVTFQIHGGGHGLAIYEVSKKTTRQDLGQFLCPGVDPATVTNPADLRCNLSADNANARHIVLDGKSDVVLVADVNATNAHPDNRIWSEPGRLMSAGAHQFLNGGTIPAGPTSNGQLLTYRFEKTGRYLVICMNRVHFLNDWMFGFVNVVGKGKDD